MKLHGASTPPTSTWAKQLYVTREFSYLRIFYSYNIEFDSIQSEHISLMLLDLIQVI